MSEDTIHDDQSHYEISLTAGQAFLAFVLMLLSLAASFAFGLMIGKGQDGDRLVVRKEPAVITEASAIPKKNDGRIVELGVTAEDFKQPETTTAATTETAPPVPTITEGVPAVEPVVEAAKPAAPPPPAASVQPVYAQLLSSSDQKTAEALAAKLIGAGFTAAYVDRTANDKGPVFRVRVKFPSEGEARASEGKLREYAKDVWIVK